MAAYRHRQDFTVPASRGSTGCRPGPATKQAIRAFRRRNKRREQCHFVPQASTESSQATSAELKAKYSKLRARQIKDKLDGLGVSTASLFDKESLVDALVQAETLQLRTNVTVARQSPYPQTSLDWRQAASLYAGIVTQQGEYAAVTLQMTNLGGQATFVIDTAASNTLLIPSAAQRLGAGRTNVSVGTGLGGTGNTTGPAYQVNLGSVALPDGLQLIDKQTAVVMELPTGDDTDGILGLDFMNTFDAIEIDWSGKPGSISFIPKGTLKTDSDWSKLTKDMSECSLQNLGMGLFSVQVSLDGTTQVPALLDSGACFSTLNDAAAKMIGVSGDTAIEPMWVAGAGGTPMALKVAERDIEMGIQTGSGTVNFRGVRALIGDLPAFSSLGLGNGPAILLGLDALLQRPRLVLSTSTGRIFL